MIHRGKTGYGHVRTNVVGILISMCKKDTCTRYIFSLKLYAVHSAISSAKYRKN